MTVLVTGGAGYIGTHTCIALLGAGYSIAVLDNYSNSNIEALERVKEITGKEFPIYNVDLLDQESVEEVFISEDIHAVIHLAGLKAVGESLTSPLLYYQNNITGTLVLCNTMQKFGVNKMVFSSSATVYGMQSKMPLVEEMPTQAINPYGQTKIMLEQIFRDVVASRLDWKVVLLRYFNPAGAHKSGLIGEDPNGIPNNLVPVISRVAIGRLEQLTVFGGDYPTPDGTCIRDYIHVMDLAEGHLKALDYISTATTTTSGVEVFNLGTGIGYSVLDVVTSFEEASGVTIPRKMGQRRQGDVPVSYADPSKAEKMLGWRTRYSLIEMCSDSWRWQVQNPNGYERKARIRQL